VVKQVLLALLVIPLAASAVFAFLGWLLRRRGSSFPLVASVISQWLVMYVVWTVGGALVQSYAIFGEADRTPYSRYGFVVFAIIFGIWQYRLARAGETRSAARVFLWSQVGWLVLVLVEGGVLG
jgi:hypothetical protein